MEIAQYTMLNESRRGVGKTALGVGTGDRCYGLRRQAKRDAALFRNDPRHIAALYVQEKRCRASLATAVQRSRRIRRVNGLPNRFLIFPFAITRSPKGMP
jgi:hypothetical protein